MHISYRPATQLDIAHCVSSMLSRGFVCEPEILSALQKLWSEWLQGGAATMVIIETRDPSGREREVAFGISVFVSEAFAAQLIASKIAPPVAAAVTQLALEGKSPVLTPAEVRRGNSAGRKGLNLLALIIGWLPEAEEDAALLSRIKAKLLEALFAEHAGYKLRRLMQEIYSEAEMKRAETIGVTVFTDYVNHFGSRPPDPETRPYLTGLERETVQESSTLWPLFLYTPPIIFFSTREQEVLRLAVIGLTDPQIADALTISQSAVHKRWHAVLKRAAAHAAVWMPESQRTARGTIGRGVEKRHFLLNYLKSHPEELRPTERPK